MQVVAELPLAFEVAETENQGQNGNTLLFVVEGGSVDCIHLPELCHNMLAPVESLGLFQVESI